MAISDLISTSFLFSISIIIILTGCIFAYISYRFSEQNHKLTSMLGLVTTLAEEIRTIKALTTVDEERNNDKNEKNEIHIFDTNMMSSGPELNLIEVSDDEEDDEEDEEDEEEDEDDEEDEEEEESDSDSDSEDEIVDLILDSTDLNVLEEMETTITNDINHEINDNNNEINNIKSIHLAEPINLVSSDSIVFESVNTNEIVNDLKTITISDIDMDLDTKPDFKRMTLNKLREVVVERNLVTDASKLKKADLLKLLGEKE